MYLYLLRVILTCMSEMGPVRDALIAPPSLEDQEEPQEELPVQLPEGDTSAEIFQYMANRQALRLSIPRSDSFSRKQVVDAFESTFQLIGGVPRLALWAHENPDAFYKLYGKLLPAQSHKLVDASGDIRIISAIPPSPLDALDAEFTEIADESVEPIKSVSD